MSKRESQTLLETPSFVAISLYACIFRLPGALGMEVPFRHRRGN